MITLAELQETEEWQKLAIPAKEHYRDDIPYHNWDGHVMSAVGDLVDLANRCEQRGILLPVGRLAVAMAWHDARNFEDPRAHHFPSEEARSAYMAEAFLIGQGKPEAYAAAVGKAIMGTREGWAHRNMDMLAAHWSDVANIGKLYEIFGANSHKILRERRMAEPDLSFAAFVTNTRAFVGVLIAESLKELPQLGEPAEGDNSFPVVALANSRALAEETEQSFARFEVAA